MVVVVLVGLISVNTKFIYPVVVMVWAFASIFQESPPISESAGKGLLLWLEGWEYVNRVCGHTYES